MHPINPKKQAIIAFTGKRGSGKDTCAEHLINLYQSEQWSAIQRINFSDRLKSTVREIFGFTHAQLNDPILKNKVVDCWPFQSPRTVMQKFATEGVRTIWPDLWVQCWLRDVKSVLKLNWSVVVTDLRFPNEREMLNEVAAGAGAQLLVVHVERPSVKVTDNHESEIHAGRLSHNVVIVNDGDIEDLYYRMTALFYPQ